MDAARDVAPVGRRRLTAPALPLTHLWLLGSGSQGNAVVVEHGGRLLMLDAGFELPELVRRLREVEIAPAFVEDVVLSHGHRDHVLGAAHGRRVYGWRVWATLGSVWQWRALRHADVAPFAPGETFTAGEFLVRTAPTPHDVPDSSAVVVEGIGGGARVAYVTDLGEATPAVRALVADVNALVLEFNHDPDLLANGPYPPEIRARVAGPTGHLSNAQAAALLHAVAHPGLALVALAHVSRQNNTPALAEAAALAALRGTGFHGEVVVAPQDRPLGPFALRRAER